jgi:hypothetical protein
MKMRTVEVDTEVYAEIQKLAKPLEDTVNSVLRRVFNLEGGVPRGASALALVATGQPRRRASFGELLSEKEYELPILESIEQMGGSAPARKVVEAVGEKLQDRLTDMDREPLPSGSEIRWHNRAAFTRLRLVERGLLKSDSPRGRWEITSEGRELLKREGRKKKQG